MSGREQPGLSNNVDKLLQNLFLDLLAMLADSFFDKEDVPKREPETGHTACYSGGFIACVCWKNNMNALFMLIQLNVRL
jgi:hypothetical protein